MLELVLENLVPIVTLIIGFAFAFIAKKGWLSKNVAEELKLDVQGAVTSVYHEFVKSRKEAAEDGKLTDEEKKEARRIALSKLGEIGKEKGVDYAKKYGIPAILGLVEKYVSSNKKETKNVEE